MSEYMSFKGFRIKKLNYEISERTDNNAEEEIRVKFNIAYLNPNSSSVDDNTGHLKVSCEIEKNRENDKCDIEVILEGAFQLANQEADVNESFLKLNGTAILMPYIRNIISMISGYDTTENHLLLPTVNVQQLFENNEN
jgi:preprotein translocase subunit SecB